VQYNKAALPKAMQVRGAAFGKMGQTKWTHLSAEDTTDKSARVPKNIQDKMLSKMAGTGDIDAAFRRKKKK
jgi:microfibrillar-associated protein 1